MGPETTLKTTQIINFFSGRDSLLFVSGLFPKNQSVFRSLLLANLGTFILLVNSGCHLEFGGDGWGRKKKNDVPAPAPVSVEAVSTGDISSFLRFHTVLTPEKEVEIFSRAVGIVVRRYAEEGDQVAVGQLLVKLEDREQSLALRRAESNFQHQDSEALHAEELYSRGMLTDDDYRRIRLARSESEIALEQARLALGYTSIQAPFAGKITRRYFDLGDRVDLSRALYTLVDASRLYADGWINELELSHIEIGDRAIVRPQGDTATSGVAHSIRIADVIDPAYGKIKVTFLLEEGGTSFKPGQFVELLLILETHRGVPIIPKRALLFEAGNPVVYIFQDSLALRRKVSTGIGEAGSIEILEGISPGDSIIIDGHSTLRDSARVRPQIHG